MVELADLDDLTLSAYQRWLRDGPLNVAEVAGMLAASERDVARVRDRLMGIGLLLASRERVGAFLAVHPDGLDVLLRDQHEQLIRRHQQLVHARTQVGAIVADFLQRRPGIDGAEVQRIDNVDQARAELLGLLGRAEREVLTLHTSQGWLVTVAPDVLPMHRRLLGRGVAMRAVLPGAAIANRSTSGYVRAAAASGLDIRVHHNLRLDTTIVDGRMACVGGSPMLLVHAPEVAALARDYFAQIWDSAAPLGNTQREPAATPVDGLLLDSERQVLRLLSLGMKDDSVARSLGISVRTVRRMIADLMDRLDARSRFQAGTIAAQRGWL